MHSTDLQTYRYRLNDKFMLRTLSINPKLITKINLVKKGQVKKRAR